MWETASGNMKKNELKRIGPVSAARIGAILTGAYVALIGGVAVLIMLAFGLIGAAGGSFEALMLTGAMLVLLVVFGALYVILGALTGFVMAIAYNYVADKFGGLQLEFA
jgi:hypothetical protein